MEKKFGYGSDVLADSEGNKSDEGNSTNGTNMTSARVKGTVWNRVISWRENEAAGFVYKRGRKRIVREDEGEVVPR